MTQKPNREFTPSLNIKVADTKNEILNIGNTWVTNGHWMVKHHHIGSIDERFQDLKLARAKFKSASDVRGMEDEKFENVIPKKTTITFALQPITYHTEDDVPCRVFATAEGRVVFIQEPYWRILGKPHQLRAAKFNAPLLAGPEEQLPNALVMPMLINSCFPRWLFDTTRQDRQVVVWLNGKAPVAA